MSPRITALVVLAALVAGGGAAAALAVTADSVSVEVSNSKSLRRLLLFTDISECDQAGGYNCYSASASVYTKTGKRVFRRVIEFNSAGKATTRYRWTCKYTGRLTWRVRVSDGSDRSTRSGGFKVQPC